MPRWLSSLLIVIGFLALVVLALAPRHITVIVDIDDASQRLSADHGGANASDPAPPGEDGDD